MHRPRTTLGAIGLTLILVAGCGSSGTASPAASSSTGTAPSASASGGPDASAVIADLETKTKAEGALNSYGMPPDWTNFGAIWDKFLPKYNLTHTDTDMSSAEEIQKFDAEKNNPVADQGDIGIQFGPVAVSSGTVQPYKPTRLGPDPGLRQGPGRQLDVLVHRHHLVRGEHGAGPERAEELGRPEEARVQGHDRDQRPAQRRPGLDDRPRGLLRQRRRARPTSTPACKYFDDLNKAGNLTSVAPSKANVEKGEAKIAILWDYNALPIRDDLAAASPAVPIRS